MTDDITGRKVSKAKNKFPTDEKVKSKQKAPNFQRFPWHIIRASQGECLN